MELAHRQHADARWLPEGAIALAPTPARDGVRRKAAALSVHLSSAALVYGGTGLHGIYGTLITIITASLSLEHLK